MEDRVITDGNQEEALPEEVVYGLVKMGVVNYCGERYVPGHKCGIVHYPEDEDEDERCEFYRIKPMFNWRDVNMFVAGWELGVS